jgi:hypothetical protein
VEEEEGKCVREREKFCGEDSGDADIFRQRNNGPHKFSHHILRMRRGFLLETALVTQDYSSIFG